MPSELRLGAGLAALILLAAAPLAAEPPLTVDAVIARPSTEARVYKLTGEAVAHETLSASFPAGGRIAEMLVAEGDRVTAGEKLARIESVQQEQAVRAAEAGVATAEASYRKAREDSARQDALLERGATTRSARDAAADQLRAAEATVAQAHADLDRAKKALSDTVLLAPAAATVTDRKAEPGQVVGAAQPVLELALGHSFDAVFEVPEVMLTSFPTAPMVTLTRLNAPGKPFRGVVHEISPLVDQARGTVKVTVRIIDPPPGLGYGDPLIGSVTRPGGQRISLPWSAMSATEKGPAVWVIDPETRVAHLRRIDVLRYETGKIVVRSGLKAGEEVVTLGSNLLYPGRTVRVKEEE
ncbi:efflux RND transporter periplasmic adaptor subunit [Acidimangrovimonas pyrenivorans]|uniref:Efflux RND transporter periplasmic adaptor subunit n=1 Tax=Acidimangrovimonas pyrenivorans TaxID=2030798 RepID=A0ABV7AM19_9RHOB